MTGLLDASVSPSPVCPSVSASLLQVVSVLFNSSLPSSRSSRDWSASPLDTHGVDRVEGYGLLDMADITLSLGSSNLFKRAMRSGSTDDSTCLLIFILSLCVCAATPAPKGVGQPGCGDPGDSSASLERHLDICLGVDVSASADTQSGSAVPRDVTSTVVSSIVSAQSVLFSLIKQVSSKAALSDVVVVDSEEGVSRLFLRASISSFLLSASSSAVTNLAASRRTLSTTTVESNTPSMMIGLGLDWMGFGLPAFCPRDSSLFLSLSSLLQSSSLLNRCIRISSMLCIVRRTITSNQMYKVQGTRYRFRAP